MKKIPLILVPGLLCDDALWADQVTALDDIATSRIIDSHRHHQSIGAMAASIVDSAPPRFALAGLSMGGYIALEICRKYGDRVDRLALVDTSARADTKEQTDRRETLIQLCRQDRFDEIVELLWGVLVHPSRKDDRRLKCAIVSMAHRVGPEVFLRQQQAIIHRSDQLPHLSKIACPTVVVCGSHDLITPVECSEEMAANIQGAKKFFIKGCGHMSTMEKPDEVGEILQEWLLSTA